MFGVFEMAFTLEGGADTCDDLDAALANDAPNGHGIDGCVLGVDIEGTFVESEPG